MLSEAVCANYPVVDMILEFATEDGVLVESLVGPYDDSGDRRSRATLRDISARRATHAHRKWAPF